MNLIISTIKELINRDLSKLHDEISNYKPDDAIWKLDGEITNTAGNLCLHICGNLQHYIGAVLGHTNYLRNRDAEFNTKGLSQQLLLNEIGKTKESVLNTLEKLDHTILDQLYPEDVYNRPMTTGYFLIHLAGHLNYHLGQINYHRRLVAKS
jgi:uncharacterized damage-inducible protein DinB